MRIAVILLLILAAVAFIIGTITAFLGDQLVIPPEGYWRGCTALIGFAIALMLCEYIYPTEKPKAKKVKK